MRDSGTRVTLFMPGTPPSLEEWNTALKRDELRIESGALRGKGLVANVEAEWVANDGAFGRAFSFGTVPAETVRSIDEAPGALVAHWPIDLRDGRQDITTLVERLRGAGALGVRLEQSKLGWDTSRWLELTTADDAWSWHRAAVTFLRSDEALQSCGMHAFSLPDVLVELDERDDDASALQHFASVLNVYQLAEDPLILSGQTFSPDHETPRRLVERWPDTGYPPDHSCHNPYGVWRIGPPGATARDQPELARVFVPALRVLLMALEAKSGTPLTRHQVEETRDKASCIAVTHRDAQELERSRGYADLDPEVAWEQWQLVRTRND